MTNTELNQNNHGIKLASAEAAAKYWAQFLPPVKGWFDLIVRAVDYMQGYNRIFPSITQKQYDVFVEALINEILNLKPPYGRHKEYVEIDVYYFDGCIDFGSHRDVITGRSFENAPTIVLNAIKIAGIQEQEDYLDSILYSFPSKICMQIYNIGHVRVVNPYYERIIYTPPNFIHYDNADNIDFSNAVNAKVKGNDFRLVEIKIADLANNLIYRTTIDFDFDNFNGMIFNTTIKIVSEENASKVYFNKSKEEIVDESIFTKLQIKNIKDKYDRSNNLTDQDLTSIFQDSVRFAELIDNNEYIYFTSNREEILKDSIFPYIGNMIAEELGDNYYRYSTPTIKIIQVPEICKKSLCSMMAANDLYIIQPNDILFKFDGSNELHVFPTSMQESFSIYACKNDECSSTYVGEISMKGEL